MENLLLNTTKYLLHFWTLSSPLLSTLKWCLHYQWLDELGFSFERPLDEYQQFICKAPLRNYLLYIQITITCDKWKRSEDRSLFFPSILEAVDEQVSHGFPMSFKFIPACIPQDEMTIRKTYRVLQKNSHATWQASNSRSPLQPPLQSCNWKGVNVPNMNGCFFWRPMGTTRKKQLWSWGARGDPTLESTILSDGCFLWRTRYVRYPPSCIRHANTHLNLITPSCGSFWAGTAWGGLNWNYASTKGCFNPPTPPLSQQSGETEWVKVQQETNADSCNKWRKFTVSNFEHACATNKVLSFSKRSNLFV